MRNKILIVIVFLLLFGWQAHIGNAAEELRIVSLSPEVTEILFALGLKNNIVGVTTYCNYPAQAKAIEKVGTFSSPNIEKILSLKPTIIFATGQEQSLVADKLRNLKLNIYVSFPQTIDDLFKSIKDIGRLTNRNKEAANLIKKMKSRLEIVKSKTQDIPLGKRPKVFVQIWQEPLITVGSKSFIDELISLAGGINITHDINRAYSYVNLELLTKRNPDCMILAYMDKEKLTDIHQAIGYRNTNAVKNNRVFNDINPDLFLRMSPRIVDGLEEIYKRIQTVN